MDTKGLLPTRLHSRASSSVRHAAATRQMLAELTATVLAVPLGLGGLCGARGPSLVLPGTWWCERSEEEEECGWRRLAGVCPRAGGDSPRTLAMLCSFHAGPLLVPGTRVVPLAELATSSCVESRLGIQNEGPSCLATRGRGSQEMF